MGRIYRDWKNHWWIFPDKGNWKRPVYGDQEGTVYKGHFGMVCYHPPFCKVLKV